MCLCVLPNTHGNSHGSVFVILPIHFSFFQIIIFENHSPANRYFMQAGFIDAFVISFLLFFISNSIKAQEWAQLGSLEGVEAVEFLSNETGYVFANLWEIKEVYRKHKDESEWKLLAIPTEVIFNRLVIGSGSNLYLYDLGKNVNWMSPDNGDNWQQMSYPFPTPNTQFMQDFGDGEILVTDGYFVHKSMNGGQIWQEVLSVIQSFGFIKIANDPLSDAIYLPASLATSGSLIYKSVDQGTTWDTITVDVQLLDFHINPNNGDMMMATSEGILSSGDEGLSWQAYGSQPDQNGLPSVQAFGFTSTGRLMAQKSVLSEPGNLFYSDDEGEIWIPVMDDEALKINDLHITPQGQIYGFRQGVVSSNDDGVNWKLDMEGINHGAVYDYVENENGVAFVASNSGIFRSLDGGNSWQRIHRNPTIIMPHIEMNDAGHLYLLYDQQLLISTDEGESFQSFDAPEVDNTPSEMVTYPKFRLHPSGALFILNLFQTHRSLDNGLTWEVSDMPFRCAGLLIDDNGNLVAHNNQSVVYSTDVGNTWATNDFPDFNISVSNNFYLFDDGEIAYVYGNPNQLYTSTDFGSSWSSTECSDCLALGLVNHFVTDHHAIFSIANSNQIRFSIDRGLSWNELPLLPSSYATRVFQTGTEKVLTSTKSGSLYLFDPEWVSIEGTLKQELDNDCVLEMQDIPMNGWKVTANGNGSTFYGYSNEQGHFLMPVRSGDYQIQGIPPNNLWEVCEKNVTLTDQHLMTEYPLGDLGVRAKELCPYMTVDISTDFLRRCFEGSFSVRYSNFGTMTAFGAFVELEIDPHFEITATSIPIVNQNGRTFTFFLGNIGSMEIGYFEVNFIVSCDAALGEWHCVEASIYPNEICGDYPKWSGSVLEVEGSCNGDETVFTVTNDGDGNMLQAVSYEIFSSAGILETGELQLNAGESLTILVESSEDLFFRTEDEAGYPFSGNPSHFVTGCSSELNSDFNWPYSYLPLSNSEPFYSSFCQQNRGAFDPNDKTAFPKGYGDDHFLEANTPIDYLIRFQNTGTDTAFKIVVIDTLSQWLDPNSIELGASSHPYTFEMSGSREEDGVVLKFIFENILLPDSNINEAASHGFVKFKIAQMHDNPIGTRIENKAAIYFDFNEPIFTNTAWHIIGEDFFPTVTATESKIYAGISLDIAPNPFSDFTMINLNGVGEGEFQLRIFDMTGREFLEKTFSQNQFLLQHDRLPDGVLVIGIYKNGQPLVFDKLVKVGQ